MLRPIFGTSTTHIPSTWTHMKFLKCCGRICVVFNMVVLRPIFGASTTHLPSGHTCMKLRKCCGCVCVVLDMVLLRPIFEKVALSCVWLWRMSCPREVNL